MRGRLELDSSLTSAQTRKMVVTANARLVMSDARGSQGTLRVTWHAAPRKIVISQWRKEVCVASTQLEVGEAPRLIAVLAEALGQAATASSPGSGASGARSPSVRAQTGRVRGILSSVREPFRRRIGSIADLRLLPRFGHDRRRDVPDAGATRDR